MDKIYDLIIIGAGPAGMTAALYALRMDIDLLIFEKNAPGGKMLNTHKIDNFPSQMNVSGGDVAQKMFQQIMELNADIKFSSVDKIESIDEKVKKVISNGEEYFAKTILIATGLKPRRLNVNNYDDFFGKGISTCLVCDGGFYRGKDIAVIGGGNSALEESLFASNIVNKINVINISSELTAFPSIKNSFNKLKNVEVYNDSELIEIKGKDKIESIIIKNNKTNEENEISISGIFTYIGWDTTLDFLDLKKIDNINGVIKIDQFTGKTNIPGVFAAGDIINKSYRQITGAVSEGTNASLSIKKYLEEE